MFHPEDRRPEAFLEGFTAADLGKPPTAPSFYKKGSALWFCWFGGYTLCYSECVLPQESYDDLTLSTKSLVKMIRDHEEIRSLHPDYFGESPAYRLRKRVLRDRKDLGSPPVLLFEVQHLVDPDG